MDLIEKIPWFFFGEPAIFLWFYLSGLEDHLASTKEQLDLTKQDAKKIQAGLDRLRIDYGEFCFVVF